MSYTIKKQRTLKNKQRPKSEQSYRGRRNENSQQPSKPCLFLRNHLFGRTQRAEKNAWLKLSFVENANIWIILQNAAIKEDK